MRTKVNTVNTTLLQTMLQHATDEESLTLAAQSLAKSKLTDPQTLQELTALKDIDHFNILDFVAKNPNTSIDTLTEIFEQRKTVPMYILASLAQNNNTPVHILENLYSYRDLAYSLAANPNTPQEILAQIYENTTRQVQVILAKNHACSPNILKKLQELYDGQINRALLENRSVSKQTRERLLNTVVPKQQQLNLKASLSTTSAEELDELSQHSNKTIRPTVALNPNCAKTTLLKLAKDNSTYDVKRIAWINPNFDQECINKVKNDPQFDLEYVGMCNPGPWETLSKVRADVFLETWEFANELAVALLATTQKLAVAQQTQQPNPKLYQHTIALMQAVNNYSQTNTEQHIFKHKILFLTGLIDYSITFMLQNNQINAAETLTLQKLIKETSLNIGINTRFKQPTKTSPKTTLGAAKNNPGTGLTIK